MAKKDSLTEVIQEKFDSEREKVLIYDEEPKGKSHWLRLTLTGLITTVILASLVYSLVMAMN